MAGPQQTALPFANDGSFMEMFAKMQQQEAGDQSAETAASSDGGGGGDGAAAPLPPPLQRPSSAGAVLSGSTGPQQQQGKAEAPEAADGEAGVEAGGEAAGAPAPPPPPTAPASVPTSGGVIGGAGTSGRPSSAPAVLLKAKKSIVQVRTRSGEPLQAGSSKRKKEGEASGGAAARDPQSFYLKEMERYRQGTCDSSANGDRPLVNGRLQTFKQFYPFYLGEHSNRTCRRLHFMGTSGVVALAAAAAVTQQPTLLLALPLIGYGCAWAGHFFFEHNRPATFRYPRWSLRGDFQMWLEMLSGQRAF